MFRQIHCWCRLAFMIIPVIPVAATAQTNIPDTTRLTLPQAEAVFLQKNLSLLAAKYNIDASRALVQQAKLWDNPVLVTDQNIYDGKFFRHNSENGQIFIQLQQLIRTAGKRSKLAQLALDNTAISEEGFNDVMRSLQYTLRSDLLETEHLLKVKRVYDVEIAEVDKLVKGMDEVYKTGNISLKDNMRLKALLFSLQNELVNINAQLIPIQSEIRLLLQSNDHTFIMPQLNVYLPDLINKTLPDEDTLVNMANANRPDVQIAKTQLLYQQDNLVYQKAMAKPDLTIGPEYDRLSSYQPNYVGLTVSLPLPFLNRNQGNIKSAQYSVKQQETQVAAQTGRVRNEVEEALDKVKYFQSINNKEQLEFSRGYDQLFRNMLDSYKQRQISLIDFTDFLDAYKDSKLKLVEQHNSLIRSMLDLDYTVNQNIIQF